MTAYLLAHLAVLLLQTAIGIQRVSDALFHASQRLAKELGK